MSYDNGFRVTYTLTGLTNATTAAAASIRVPTHKSISMAAIEDIQVTPTVAVVNTTGAMQVQIGTAATTGKYAAQNCGTTAGLAVGASYGVADVDGRVAAYNPDKPFTSTQKGFIDLKNDGDAAGTLLTALKISTLVGTGTPAGTVTASITIRWF